MIPYKEISTVTWSKRIENLWNNKTMYGILSNVVLGWLKPQLQKLDIIRYKKWITFYNLDACEKDIPHKLGAGSNNNNRYVLLASTLRVLDDYGIQLDSASFLEKAGEGYDKVYQHKLAKIIANNMKYCVEPEICDQNDNAKTENGPKLSWTISIDIGSECNADNIRNALLYGIKQKLGINQDDKSWYNEATGLKYRFDECQLNVNISIHKFSHLISFYT